MDSGFMMLTEHKTFHDFSLR